MDWNAYEPFDPGVRGPLHKLPKAEARAWTKKWLSRDSQWG